MTSYNLVNGQHTNAHWGLLEDILRCEYRFQGIVLTDWILLGGAKDSVHKEPTERNMAKAGNDLIMPGIKKHFRDIYSALKRKELDIQQEKINATRVYRMINRLTKQ